MFDLIITETPIPSCKIHEIKFDTFHSKWLFFYRVETPVKLEGWKDLDLIVYEHISSLRLKNSNSVHNDSVNIHVSSYEQYKELLNKQLAEDLKYRKMWLKNHPNSKPSTVKLENRDYDSVELANAGVHYIAGVYQQEDFYTEFAAV